MASWCYVCSRKVPRNYKWLAGVKVHQECYPIAENLFLKEMGRLPNVGRNR